MHHVFELKRFDSGGVEYLAVIAQRGQLQTVVQLFDFLYSRIKYVLLAKHAAMFFHRQAQLVTQLIHRFAIALPVPARHARHGALQGALGHRPVVAVILQVFEHVIAGGTAEDNQVKQ